MFNSALYVGHVMHHRLTPKHYTVRQRVYWLLVDLSEIEALSGALNRFSYNGRNILSLRDRDHGDGSRLPLLGQAQALLGEAGIAHADLSIRLLCMPRVFGYDFNPISVYFCVGADETLSAMIYEVNNTFGGRHRYVLPVGDNGGKAAADAILEQACSKELYVSPFMDMDMMYRLRTQTPTEKVSLDVDVIQGDRTIIRTGLRGRRQELTDANLMRAAMAHPMLPMKVMGAIHWHALRMWMAGFKVNPEKPSKSVTQSIVRPN